VGATSSVQSAVDASVELLPAVLVMDVNRPDIEVLNSTRELVAAMPTTPLIVVSVQEEGDYRRQALGAGARAYLVKPFSPDDLILAIRQLAAPPPAPASSDEPRTQPLMKAVAPPEPAAGSADELWTQPMMKAVSAPLSARAAAAQAASQAPSPPAEQAAARQRPEHGQVTLIFSGKGGVGKSVIAVNLAAVLAAEGEADVALVDLDLQFGDLAVMLGLDPDGTFADIAQAYPRVDSAYIASLMAGAPGGFQVLAAPVSPELADLVTAEHVRSTIEILKAAFDHVVIDCSSRLDDVSLEAIEAADRVLLVTDINIPSIKDAKLAFKLLESLKVARERIHLVLNRYDSPTNVTVEELESHLKATTVASIPSQGKLVLRSIQEGIPVVKLDPASEFTQKVKDLAARLVPLAGPSEPAGKGGRRGFWARSS
jgi:pilus assembly protein CpaE